MLVASLAGRLGIEGLAGRLVKLRSDRRGAATAGRKVMALMFAMVLGADSIDDGEILRVGKTRRLLGGWIPAPSTPGTFLRAFTFGHVHQLDKLLGESLVAARRAGAGPGDGRLVIACRLERAGWQYSIGVRMHKAIRGAVEAIGEDTWQTDRLPRRGRGADRRDASPPT